MTNSNDWPLVFFTMFSQISVGMLIGGLILYMTVKNTEAPALETLKKVLIIAAFGSMGIALVLSFLHLASPLHAVYAMSNAGSSWLSREIILASIYLLSLVICYASLRYNVPHRNLFSQLYLASLIIGLILIWAMSRVYMIPTVPLWNTPATPVAFYTTALILGGGGALVIINLLAAKNAGIPELQTLQTTMFYLISAAVFITLLNMLLLQPDIGALAGSFAAPTISPWWKTAQIVFLLAGFSLITYWFTYQMPAAGGNPSNLVYAAFVCLLISEIAGRYLFYASFYRVGV